MSRKIVFAILMMLSFSVAAQLPDFTELVEKQGPAVVNISTTQTVHHPDIMPQIPDLSPDDPFYQFFRRFMPNPDTPAPHDFQSNSLGSGFIISPDGYILTNFHVVEAADEITVKLTDKREFKARIIGSDKRTDIALIKIDASGLQAVKFGDPGHLKVGEWVVAIGSPFGFENSVTAGIVSAKGRSLPDENLVPFIQSDVAVNPGNSGGPLFNMRGEVVGINSQIYSRTGGFMGLSFAIPIDVANDVATQLRTSGKVKRGRIGVMIQSVTKDLAESFGLTMSTGALVSSVEKDSPADKAGIENGDVILKFDGKTVDSSDDLPRLVGATKPGTRVVMLVMRDKVTREVPIVIGEMMADDDDTGFPQPQPHHDKKPQAPDSVSRLGISASEPTSQERNQLNITGGIVVEDVEGIAERAGLQRGDIILAVNNQKVKSIEQFGHLMEQFKKDDIPALLVQRNDMTLYIPLRIENAG
jgi:serine protease Do